MREKGGVPLNIVILGQEARYRAYRPAMPFVDRQTPVFLDKDSTETEIAAAASAATSTSSFALSVAVTLCLLPFSSRGRARSC